jgi:hypothetical protein
MMLSGSYSKSKEKQKSAHIGSNESDKEEPSEPDYDEGEEQIGKNSNFKSSLLKTIDHGWRVSDMSRDIHMEIFRYMREGFFRTQYEKVYSNSPVWLYYFVALPEVEFVVVVLSVGKVWVGVDAPGGVKVGEDVLGGVVCTL